MTLLPDSAAMILRMGSSCGVRAVTRTICWEVAPLFREPRNAAPLAGPGAEIYRAGMLVGRNAEQRQLDRLLQRARAGISGVLVLRGDPGIGKTALVDYAASRAGPMRILRATGIEAETGLAFAGLYSLLLSAG